MNKHRLQPDTTWPRLESQAAVDGAYFGGYIKPPNRREDRKDRRRRVYQTGKRQVVIVARELNGETRTHIAKSEAEGVDFVMSTVAHGVTVHADEASHWDALEARYLTKRINHSEAYSLDGACTNMAESFFSRLRRAEIGTHHHIAGKYLSAYAAEMAWREDRLDPLAPDLASEHRPEPVPPEPHRLMADIDPALSQQILHVPKGERVPHVHHHHEANDLGGGVEAIEGVSGLRGRAMAEPLARHPASGAVSLTEPSRTFAKVDKEDGILLLIDVRNVP